MPTYEYKCEECGILFERFQHFSEDPVTVCPECNGPVHRVICPVGIIFKGSGFYVTDSRSRDTSSTMPKSDKKESPADKPSEAKASDTSSTSGDGNTDTD